MATGPWGLPISMGPWGVPHGEMMENHAPSALFKNPTRMRVARLIGDRCRMQLPSYIHDSRSSLVSHGSPVTIMTNLIQG